MYGQRNIPDAERGLRLEPYHGGMTHRLHSSLSDVPVGSQVGLDSVVALTLLMLS